MTIYFKCNGKSVYRIFICQPELVATFACRVAISLKSNTLNKSLSQCIFLNERVVKFVALSLLIWKENGNENENKF